MALAAVGAATADPSVASKQAEAQHVLDQIQQLDGSVERAVEAYNEATARLKETKSALRVNKVALHVARVNFSRAQAALGRRLVDIYTSESDRSTIGVILGSSSLDDLLNNVESVQSVARQDQTMVRQVTVAQATIKEQERVLEHARAVQAQAVATRAAERASIESQLVHRKALLSSIRGQIAQIRAQEAAQQRRLAAAAQQRIAGFHSSDNSGLGVSASTPDATVAPPSHYGGVVGYAMSQLGKPYVWGAAGPDSYDCSGLVMWAYAQVGVSLPHYTVAQWNAGVPVSRDQLQPGDLVFFNGLSHVGIYIGGGQFIHAPHTGDVVKISSLGESWYASTFDGARRITG